MTRIEYYCCYDYETLEPCTPVKDFKAFKNQSWSPCCERKFNQKVSLAPTSGYYQRYFDASNHELIIRNLDEEKEQLEKRQDNDIEKAKDLIPNYVKRVGKEAWRIVELLEFQGIMVREEDVQQLINNL